MRSSPVRSALVAVLLATFGTTPQAWAAWSHDMNVNLPVGPGSGVQIGPAMAPDGAGGFFVAWTDNRSGNGDIYLQRITASGNIAPGWPATGYVVCNASGNQGAPSAANDLVGGVYVAWEDGRTSPSDRDIYMSHVQSNATLAPGWAVNGRLLPGLAGKDEYGVKLAANGTGGVWAAWSLVYTPTTDEDVYGAHVNAAGTTTYSGVFDGPTNVQNLPSIVSDGSGNAIVACINNDYGGSVGAWGVHYLKVNTVGSWAVSPVQTNTPALTIFVAPSLLGDGSGGAFISYLGGTFDNLYIQHLTTTGAIAPGAWSSFSCINLTSESNNNYVGRPYLASDGSGGALVGWYIYSPTGGTSYVNRILGNGYLAGGWPNTGRYISYPDALVGLIPDGAGGAVAAMQDQTFFPSRYDAARINSGGGVQWYSQIAGGGQPSAPLAALPDGAGGMFASFVMLRSGPAQMLAQNVDAFGALGDARPAITKVADLPNDQGGGLSVQWTASYLDAQPWNTIANYSVWRRVPGGTTAAGSLAPSNEDLTAAFAAAAPALAPRRITTIARGQVVYWEYVTSEPARMFPGYSAVVPTPADSSSLGYPRTSVMIMAENAGGSRFWASAPDSGYSVDNLPPPPPTPFSGTYAGGASSLTWGAVTIADLAGYKLYRGGTSAFVASPATLVTSTPLTNWNDNAGGPFWYRVTAVDIHGNESTSSPMLPSGTTGVGGGPKSYTLAFSPPAPNPTPGPLAFRFELPAEGVTRLTVYDVRGRRVRDLIAGRRAAGEGSATWDLRDDAGHRVGMGLYVARFEAAGRVLTRRVMVVE